MLSAGSDVSGVVRVASLRKWCLGIRDEKEAAMQKERRRGFQAGERAQTEAWGQE